LCCVSFAEFAAKPVEARVEVVGCLTDAVFYLRVVICPEEMLLFPFVCFFADVDDPRCDNVPTFSAPSVGIIPI
jgi:hypothetical protein